LADLGVEYVDLYLMHYPCAFKSGEDLLPFDPDGKIITEQIPFIETWRAMEKLLDTGKARAIGVSNSSKTELEVILREGNVVCGFDLLSVKRIVDQFANRSQPSIRWNCTLFSAT
jgi:diketogulonate reductase-like aldo/keto reductase